MKSSNPAQTTPQRQPARDLLFWPSAQRASSRSKRDAALSYLIPDHAPTLQAVETSGIDAAADLIVFPSGGFSVPVAAAFGFLDKKLLSGLLLDRQPQKVVGQEGGEEEPTITGAPVKKLVIPAALAETAGVKANDTLGSYHIQVISQPFGGVNDSFAEQSSATATLLRLLTGLRLWVGQMIIFALPVFVFGWLALLKVGAAMLAAAVLLALLWRVLPRPATLKGAITGLALALLYLLGISLFLNQIWSETGHLLLAACILIINVWMSVVMVGLAPKKF